MRLRSWKYHLTRMLIGLLLALFAGWLFDHPVLFPFIYLLAYLAWQFYNSLRLHHWMNNWHQPAPDSFGMWSEIFDRMSAMQKLNNKRQRKFEKVIDDFQGMADAFPDATLVLDKNDVITWFNDSAIQLLDLKEQMDRGQAVTNLIREPGFSSWLAVQDKVTSRLEIPCPSDDNITLLASVARFRKNQRLLILRDITDIQNLERMRRDFVANVSHELRTPLTVLIGYLELLNNQEDNRDADVIKRMYKQARQINSLLEDLLELSRLQDADFSITDEDVDVPAMLAQLKEQAGEYDQVGHSLQFDIQADLKLSGIEVDLRSAFQNLINNAINYTPAEGKITVKWAESEDGLEFSVKDTGVGIPHRDIPRITERFYRVGSDRARNSGGTGLGLAIVKHVLNAHQARLEISSNLGEGSEFKCIFPAKRKA
jgi:two-component system phosphate regulon sensor histidine kinase PhoR